MWKVSVEFFPYEISTLHTSTLSTLTFSYARARVTRAGLGDDVVAKPRFEKSGLPSVGSVEVWRELI
jgi:hypothetical protein